MVIRKAQVATFESSAREQFESELLEHMHGFAPELCRLHGDPPIRKIIKSGVERAEKAGFETRGPAQLFVELIFVLGHGFDTDPQLEWVRVALGSAPAEDEETRSTRLYVASRNYLNEVAGPDNAYASEALGKINSLQNAVANDGRPLGTRILEAMQYIYPQKYKAVGEAALRAIIIKSRQVAGDYQLPPDASAPLLSGLMFGFGHMIFTDPLYPWVGSTVTDPRVTDRAACVARLQDKLKVYVAAMQKRTS